jgi:hypothetical protein
MQYVQLSTIEEYSKDVVLETRQYAIEQNL